ncbi:MAG: response regulator [Xanthobacteraceae bacterium]|nr:response regulator [Xanthobacteraceae bacterium]
MRQASILIVEDEALIRMMLVEMVETLGHKVIGEAGRIDEGRALAKTLEYDLAILDINLQGLQRAARRRGGSEPRAPPVKPRANRPLAAWSSLDPRGSKCLYPTPSST